MECNEVKTLDGKKNQSRFKYKPMYQIITTDFLGDPIFCYEFEGCLRSYYEDVPSIVQVHKWKGELSLHFWEHYVDCI